ncbi:MAG: hypothetical protein GF401_08685 [Chitinivibrionales bacterium]|nr:hypothetical protein [Chitinivibrionales bacterium]
MNILMRLVMPQVFFQELRKIFAYRVNFWIQFVVSLLAQFSIAYFLWKAVFESSGAEKIGGYSFRSMMIYYLLVPVIGRAVRGMQFGNFSEDIYQGALTKYLVYPVSVFVYKFTANLAHCVVFAAQSILIIILSSYIADPSELSLTLSGIVQGFLAVAAASLLFFTFNSMIELIAFWADNVWSLLVIARFITGLLGGSMLPLSLFPQWIQPLLTALPFAYFASFPIRCLMGEVTFTQLLQGLGIMALWNAVFTAGFMLIWYRGKYKYTGVGI